MSVRWGLVAAAGAGAIALALAGSARIDRDARAGSLSHVPWTSPAAAAPAKLAAAVDAGSPISTALDLYR